MCVQVVLGWGGGWGWGWGGGGDCNLWFYMDFDAIAGTWGKAGKMCLIHLLG